MFARVPAPKSDLVNGLTHHQLKELATYNAERLRGLLHSELWHSQMAELQKTFDDHRGGLVGRV